MYMYHNLDIIYWKWTLEMSPAALWTELLLNELVLLEISMIVQEKISLFIFFFSTFFSFLLYISLTCMLRVKSASVKALLSEEASDGKRKVRKMIIWGFELICIWGMGMCGR